MTAREVVDAIEQAGWRKDRQKGSHAVFKHDDRSGRIVVPMHQGDLPKGTVRDILKKAGIQR
ncbi:MAG: type II toxin-antitoxin system HicA family toxin [Fimbriimonadaceae bacterium]|nr:type II toxin-antitoxin system HicA family toxin [Fimbriimonadaceae bacterium]